MASRPRRGCRAGPCCGRSARRTASPRTRGPAQHSRSPGRAPARAPGGARGPGTRCADARGPQSRTLGARVGAAGTRSRGSGPHRRPRVGASAGAGVGAFLFLQDPGPPLEPGVLTSRSRARSPRPPTLSLKSRRPYPRGCPRGGTDDLRSPSVVGPSREDGRRGFGLAPSGDTTSPLRRSSGRTCQWKEGRHRAPRVLGHERQQLHLRRHAPLLPHPVEGAPRQLRHHVAPLVRQAHQLAHLRTPLVPRLSGPRVPARPRPRPRVDRPPATRRAPGGAPSTSPCAARCTPSAVDPGRRRGRPSRPRRPSSPRTSLSLESPAAGAGEGAPGRSRVDIHSNFTRVASDRPQSHIAADAPRSPGPWAHPPWRLSGSRRCRGKSLLSHAPSVATARGPGF